MTIRDIIERVKARRTSPLPESLLIAALSELDMRIEQDIVRRHEGESEARDFPYSSDTVQLIAPARFAKMYEHYLCLEIDLQLDEMQHYANDVQLFGQAYSAFSAWYNETHMPRHEARLRVAPHYKRRGGGGL